MADECYAKGKGPVQRIHARLGNQKGGRDPHHTVTHPTRTVHNVYQSGFQAQLGHQVKRNGDGNGEQS
jgi:hypothetical protein